MKFMSVLLIIKNIYQAISPKNIVYIHQADETARFVFCSSKTG